MSKKNVRRRRRRRSNFFPTIIGMLCVVVLVLGAAIFIEVKLNQHYSPRIIVQGNDASAAMSGSYTTPGSTQDNALTLTAQSFVTPTPSPSPTPIDQTPAPTPTPVPTPTPKPTFEYLPVYKKGATIEKRIAITVDDCFQLDNLKTIIALAYQNGGKLTIFPIGQNVMKAGMDEILQVCVFDLGFEIENHTWSHARVFRLSEQEMAEEIWKQRVAVNHALGVDYEQHFFRLMGGDGEYDQRTHNYLKQLGYKGIADWSLSGSDASLNTIKNSLAPGMVYLFHTTDADTEKLKEFIPYAVSEGYELVTLNEMFGMEENTWTEVEQDPLTQTMLQPQPYTTVYRDQRVGDYSWSVVEIQRRLLELGYLSANSRSATPGDAADGVFGEGTSAAISAFQAACGLYESGIADVETQELLFAEDAPRKV